MFGFSHSLLAQGIANPAITDTLIKPHANTCFATTTPDKQPTVLPQNFYTQHLPFFCRQELKMQQAHVPVTFRLGSMDYCNYLEQKPGYR